MPCKLDSTEYARSFQTTPKLPDNRDWTVTEHFLVHKCNWICWYSPNMEKSHLFRHERVDYRCLVLAGSECIFTDITEHIYFSLIQTDWI